MKYITKAEAKMHILLDSKVVIYYQRLPFGPNRGWKWYKLKAEDINAKVFNYHCIFKLGE
jgi:hypothetical protein